MKLCHLYESSLGRILVAALAILFTLYDCPVSAASEPGTVTILVMTEPMHLDPGDNISSVEGQILMRNILESLTEMNPEDSSIMPSLATSWKQVDPNTWHFFLRKGVKFHDGEDFNAQAVIFNIKRIYNEKIFSRTRLKFFAQVRMEQT
jgi:peptide/nickel transport system substrate-binding protein